MLNKLYQEQVVSFELSEDKKLLEIKECCDYWYTASLTKLEALQMIEELKELINLMEE